MSRSSGLTSTFRICGFPAIRQIVLTAQKIQLETCAVHYHSLVSASLTQILGINVRSRYKILERFRFQTLQMPSDQLE